MLDPICVFRFRDKLRHQPFVVQGGSGVKYGTATYNEKYAGHTFEMPLSQVCKVGADLVAGFDRPLCKFFLCDVQIPEDEQKTVLTQQVAAFDEAKNAMFDDAFRPEGTMIARSIGKNGAFTLKRYRLVEIIPPKPREKWNFKEWYAHAKKIGVPRYSIIAKSGRKEPLQAAVEAHEKAVTHQDGKSNPAPAPLDQAAA